MHIASVRWDGELNVREPEWPGALVDRGRYDHLHVVYFGIATPPLPWPAVAEGVCRGSAFALFLDGIKIPIFARLKIS